MAERMVLPKWSYMEVLWAPVWDTINIATLLFNHALFGAAVFDEIRTQSGITQFTFNLRQGFIDHLQRKIHFLARRD